MSPMKTSIEILEHAKDYVGIHYVNGVEDPYISSVLLRAIEDGIAALRVQQQPNDPLTLDELREMNGDPVWIVIIDHDSFADKNDDFDGWGLCRKSWVRMWDEKRADLVRVDHQFEDYGKAWLAYRRKPEEAAP